MFSANDWPGVKYIPGVIEPSFGLGRILYSVLENSYYVRPGGDASRAVSARARAMNSCLACFAFSCDLARKRSAV